MQYSETITRYSLIITKYLPRLPSFRGNTGYIYTGTRPLLLNYAEIKFLPNVTRYKKGEGDSIILFMIH